MGNCREAPACRSGALNHLLSPRPQPSSSSFSPVGPEDKLGSPMSPLTFSICPHHWRQIPGGGWGRPGCLLPALSLPQTHCLPLPSGVTVQPSSPQARGEWPLPRSTGKPPLPGQREAQPPWSPAPSTVFAEEAENKGPAHIGEQGLGAIAPGTSPGLSPSVSGPPVGATSLCLV